MFEWRRWVINPITITVFLLVLAFLIAFIWSASYVNSVASTIQPNHTGSTLVGGNATGPQSSNPSQSAVSGLLGKVHAAVWSVRTLDGNGDATSGSAFAVVTNPTTTLMLTSFAVVAAASYQPPPQITVSQGSGTDLTATLVSWDRLNDLALLSVAKGSQPIIAGTGASQPQPGQQVFIVDRPKNASAAVATVKLLDPAVVAISGDTNSADAARGAAVLDISGSVLGVDSADFTPVQTTTFPSGAHFVVPIQLACKTVLSCPGGAFPAA